MAEPPTFIDFAGSFRDHTLAFNSFSRRILVALFLEYLAAVPFDTAAIGTLDISSQSKTRYIRQLFFDPFYSFGNLFRRLIVHEVLLNKRTEISMRGDLLADLAFRSHPDVVQMMCICCIIFLSLPSFRKLVPYAALGTMKGLPNFFECISFVSENFYFSSISGRES